MIKGIKNIWNRFKNILSEFESSISTLLYIPLIIVMVIAMIVALVPIIVGICILSVVSLLIPPKDN